jgi:hypothetical protein
MKRHAIVGVPFFSARLNWSNKSQKRKFDPQTFLSTIGGGRKIIEFPKRRTIFAQGERAMLSFIYRR